MLVCNHGKWPIDFTGDPDEELRKLKRIEVGEVVTISALTDRLRKLGLRPAAGTALGTRTLDADALRAELDDKHAALEAAKAGESAMAGRVDALRLSMRDTVDALRAAKDAQEAERLRREQAERERDQALDRLASAGGESGRPWLAEEHDDLRVAMVNAWRLEEDENARPFKAAAYADAWLYRQSDVAVAERFAAALEAVE